MLLFSMSNALATTDASFATDIAKGLVMVDMYADWCGPCRMMGPVIDQLASEHAGAMRVYKLDIDNNPHTAMQYGVRSIPTFLLLKDGQLVDTMVGALPKETMHQRILQQINPIK
jgi:thioredoxin 1